ncbi:MULTISPECIES: metallophosphoesterase [unclassified Bradyrhizobium]|uniref:metallophosphoesterase n=1 Tax=unclassified Bradyrhizobium TaxID=2631580 RepID=UPI0028F0D2C5|nr:MULTISPECIES: metallophosphoesterase [unclassified Bradyrhizobium]
MHLHVFSDLHTDTAEIKPIEALPGIDVAVVAGDVCEGVVNGFARLREIVAEDVPIVMVMGNHEFYHRTYPEELKLARAEAARFGVHLLENEAVVLAGVRFAGATLWTDYAIFGPGSEAEAMAACGDTMHDHRCIIWQDEPWLRFTPREALGLHLTSRTWLTGLLETPFDGPTVVVTHHAPGWGSVAERYHNDLTTAAFASDLSALILATQPALWIHGHIHTPSDYRVGTTCVICNPHGYGRENPDFDPELVVEV